MTLITELEHNIEQIIDDLKGLCQTLGLANQSGEEEIITNVFLYKFLNDKFVSNLKEFANDIDIDLDVILNDEDNLLEGFYDSYPADVAFRYEDTIQFLINKVNQKDFYKLFEETLTRISEYPENEKFGIQSASGSKRLLFTNFIKDIPDEKKNSLCKSIFGIISQDRFDFGPAFKNNFDFYSRIFEYLIKDYNVAAGVYAEYFTPQVISGIIAKILVNMSPVEDKIYEIYDPSAGSGSLVLHLANALGKGTFGSKAQVYTQDISGKSSRFLRINMMLNGLTNSLDNIIEGDTLDSPAHYNTAHDPGSGFKKFDYITSNPPFNMDFSATRDSIEQKWANVPERFFAGIPKIPNKKKESMAIYLCFIQHILWSLKDDGKAAIVVPTGFLTKNQSIEFVVRKKIIDEHWIKGVISMPSNIFANTGTNFSVLFIDKANTYDKVILIDATKLGKKVKLGKNQRTVLEADEISLIEDTFINRNDVEEFGTYVSYDRIIDRKYSLAAGQYFDVKLNFVEISEEEYYKNIADIKNELNKLFVNNDKLISELNERLNHLKYETN